ncbi:MAG: radical SAM protein [Flavobacterium sp.]|nr:radical SAM protein [Flavobacterium sp.]
MKRLILTYNQSCNLTCDFCYVSFHHEKIDDKTIEIINRVIELEFDIITFGGGDAFSKKKFREACEICKKHNLKTHVDTNCIAIKNKDFTFIENYVDLLGISIDGVGEMHNRMRKSDNLFAKVDQVLSTLQKQGIQVKINTVVTKKNKEDVINIFKYLQKFNNISIWSLYQFFPLDAAKNNKDFFEINDLEFELITKSLHSNNFKIEKFKFSSRVSGYIFSDELGHLYTNNINGNYISIGSIFDKSIDDKLKTLNLGINPIVQYRY